jgi:hypothetical protein
MKKAKLTYAEIEALEFLVRMFQKDYKLAQRDSMQFEALRIKLIVMRAEMEYSKNRESV